MRLHKLFAITVASGLAVIALAAITFIYFYLRQHGLVILQPSGQVGLEQQRLIFVACILSIIVVVPTYAMTLFIVLRYRKTKKERAGRPYSPNWESSVLAELIWWGIPCIIIAILSVITWQTSHSLDPYHQLTTTQKPLTIEVIALDWKWLFIYPEQHLASVNEVALPVNRPVEFVITSDTVMNSFWIPSLGGQIYAMPGMSTQLHLITNHLGTYRGASANISGEGFADMTFKAKAMAAPTFAQWVQRVAASPQLTQKTYATLSKPGVEKSVHYYSITDNNLYNEVVMKYMMPQTAPADSHKQPSPNTSTNHTSGTDMPDMMPGMKM